VGAISAALLTGGMFNTPLMVGAHAVLGACLVFQTWKLDQSEYTVEAIQGFYRFIWNLFYSGTLGVEYVLLGLKDAPPLCTTRSTPMC
jgi:hypothetical protein